MALQRREHEFTLKNMIHPVQNVGSLFIYTFDLLNLVIQICIGTNLVPNFTVYLKVNKTQSLLKKMNRTKSVKKKLRNTCTLNFTALRGNQ